MKMKSATNKSQHVSKITSKQSKLLTDKSSVKVRKLKSDYIRSMKSVTGKSQHVRKIVKTQVEPLTNSVGKVRELKSEDIRAMRPASGVLPKQLLDALPKRKRGERGAQKQPKKVSVTLRYSPEVVNYFKSTGEGWQSRMDNVLMGYIKKHPKPMKKGGESKHVKHHNKHSQI